MDLTCLDAQSLRLVVQLYRQDIEDLVRQSKGKCKEGDASDSDIARQTLSGDLAALALSLTDHAMCQSIARAVVTDGELICTVKSDESQATRDRQMALGLNSRRALPTIPEMKPDPNDSLDEEFVAKLTALYVGYAEDDADQPESSSWAASRQNPEPQRLAECTSCREEHPFFDVARCPCQHEYCRDCLANLFEASLSDESLFPPRCCRTNIPLETSRIFLSSTLVGQFQAKKVELETTNPTYCHKPSCSKFIPMQFGQRR